MKGEKTMGNMELMAFIALGVVTVATCATDQVLLSLTAGIPFIIWGVQATSGKPKKPSGSGH